MRLYEIDQEIEQALNRTMIDEETGEILACPDMERLNELQMEREKKLENVAIFVKNARAEAAAIAAELKELTKRKRVLDNQAERTAAWLALVLDGEKFSTPKASVSFRKSLATEIDDISKIPEEFLKYADPTADKEAIKRAIKEGQIVDGAHLETRQSIIIK